MIDCDFIPESYHERRRLRHAIRLRATCVVVLFMFMVLWWMVNESRITEARAMLTDVALQKKQIDLVAARKAVLEQEKQRLADRRRLLRQLSGRASPVIVLSELSRVLSDRIVLIECSLHDPLLSSYASPENGAQNFVAAEAGTGLEAGAAGRTGERHIRGLRMVGAAVSLHDVLRLGASLEANPLFGRVNLNTGAESSWAGMRVHRFELHCELIPQELDEP